MVAREMLMVYNGPVMQIIPEWRYAMEVFWYVIAAAGKGIGTWRPVSASTVMVMILIVMLLNL